MSSRCCRGFLKSIANASNCCDKQEDDDAGRHSVKHGKTWQFLWLVVFNMVLAQQCWSHVDAQNWMVWQLVDRVVGRSQGPELGWSRKLIEEIGLHMEAAPNLNRSWIDSYWRTRTGNVLWKKSSTPWGVSFRALLSKKSNVFSNLRSSRLVITWYYMILQYITYIISYITYIIYQTFIYYIYWYYSSLKFLALARMAPQPSTAAMRWTCASIGCVRRTSSNFEEKQREITGFIWNILEHHHYAIGSWLDQSKNGLFSTLGSMGCTKNTGKSPWIFNG